jgi:hypothetical protein
MTLHLPWALTGRWALKPGPNAFMPWEEVLEGQFSGLVLCV